MSDQRPTNLFTRELQLTVVLTSGFPLGVVVRTLGLSRSLNVLLYLILLIFLKFYEVFPE